MTYIIGDKNLLTLKIIMKMIRCSVYLNEKNTTEEEKHTRLAS